MKQWWLEITLKSDLCTASGGGIAGLVDTEVTEENGIPVIPARRIKGNLLEIGKEFQENGILIEKNLLNNLFGEIGSERPGLLRIHDAHLYFIPKSIMGNLGENGYYVKDYENLQTEMQKIMKMDIEQVRVKVLELFTRMRTRTAIDEKTGTAKTGTLRTMRVIRSGIKFRSLLEIDENDLNFYEKDMEGKIEETLEFCAKGLRHIGLGVTRGFGEVSCQLVKLDQKEQENCFLIKQRKIINEHFDEIRRELERYGKEDNVSVQFDIQLLQPLLLSGKKGLYEDCESMITGKAIQGAMAGAYIKKKMKQAGVPHEDKDFSRIFLRDGVKFGYGFLKKGKCYYYPCPSSIVKLKNEDSCFNRVYEKGDTARKRRKSINKMIVLDKIENQIYLAVPEKEMRMHHARPLDRGIGHALGDRVETNQEQMGRFFQYVALKKGQVFGCEWQGKKEDIESLFDCLKSLDFQLRLGRSQSAEYGNSLFVPISIKKAEPLETIVIKEQVEEKMEQPLKLENIQKNKWIISLLTPMVLRNPDNGRVEANPNHFISLMNEMINDVYGSNNRKYIELYEESEFLKFTHVGGYNSKWRLPCEQKPALEAGTVLVITTEIIDFNNICKKLEDNYWGEMTGAGYGKIKIEPYAEKEKNYTIIYDDECNSKRNLNQDETKKPGLWKNDLVQDSLEDEDKKEKITEKILELIEEHSKVQNEKENALKEEGELRIHATLVEQLISMFYQIKRETTEQGIVLSECSKSDGKLIYDKIMEQVKKMNDSKKQEAEVFFKACENKTIAFMETYLKKGKWSVRNETEKSEEEK